MSVRAAIGTMAEHRKRPPGEALVDLRRRLSLLPARDPGRTEVIQRAAQAYGVSIWTIYRALRELTQPKSVRRSDHGSTRAAPMAEMERYAEIIAALKIRTLNKQGRHLSTARAIRLLEEDGVETPDGLVRAPEGVLRRATVDRILRSPSASGSRRRRSSSGWRRYGVCSTGWRATACSRLIPRRRCAGRPTLSSGARPQS
jgi:hypothetical protein